MACSNCDFQGYIESEMRRDAGLSRIVQQCRECNDIQAYSRRIREIMTGSGPSMKKRLRVIEGGGETSARRGNLKVVTRDGAMIDSIPNAI